MSQWQHSQWMQALCLLLSVAFAQTAELTTFYTLEYPEYSFPAQEVSLVYTIEAPAGGSAPAPLSLTTVLDRSGSMSGRNLDLLKKTNQFLVETMMKNNGLHDLGIVTYSNLLDELVQLQPVTDQTGPLMNYRIQNIQAAGSTFLSGGLTKGLEQQKNRPSDKVQSVYLFTDGLPTIGPTKSWEILNEVRKIRDNSPVPISIYTFGFGEDVDAQLLWDIANEGNGVAYVIANENDIPVAFGDALGALLSSFAQDVRVLFKPTDGSRIKKIESSGQVNVLSDGSVEVRLYDLFAQETRDILVTIEAPGTSNPGYQRLLFVDTKYKDAVTRQETGGSTVTVGCERVPEPVVVQPAERVEVTKVYIITAKALSSASEKVESGDEEGAKQAIEEAENAVEGSGLKDRPRLSGLLRDIRKVREAVVDKVLSNTRGGGLLRNLVSAVRDARSSRTGSDQLETAEAQDSEAKKEVREEATQGVLGDRDFVVRSAPPGSLEGDDDTGAPDTSTAEGDSEESDSENAEDNEEQDGSDAESQEEDPDQQDDTNVEEVVSADDNDTADENANDVASAEENTTVEVVSADENENVEETFTSEVVASEDSANTEEAAAVGEENATADEVSADESETAVENATGEEVVAAEEDSTEEEVSAEESETAVENATGEEVVAVEENVTEEEASTDESETAVENVTEEEVSADESETAVENVTEEEVSTDESETAVENATEEEVSADENETANDIAAIEEDTTTEEETTVEEPATVEGDANLQQEDTSETEAPTETTAEEADTTVQQGSEQSDPVVEEQPGSAEPAEATTVPVDTPAPAQPDLVVPPIDPTALPESAALTTETGATYPNEE